jgi:DNA-directed RNA polymerase subunit beta'
MQALLDRLQNLDADAKIAELQEYIAKNKHKGPKAIDKQVKALKALLSLKDQGLTPYEAYTRDTVPVIPAQYRAPIQLPNDTFMVPDVNDLIRDIGFMSNTLKDISGDLPPDELEKARAGLYKSVEALQGFETPQVNRQIKRNYYTSISGKPGPAKKGFYQSTLTRKRVDLSGRSVISPNPQLDMDQVEIPIDMGMTMFKPFIKKELISRGFSSQKADSMVEKKDKRAIDALHRAGKERPVLINRAPTIAEGSITAHWPTFVDKMNINIPNALALFQKADFDGDSCLCDIRLRHKVVHSPLRGLWAAAVNALVDIPIMALGSMLCFMRRQVLARNERKNRKGGL